MLNIQKHEEVVAEMIAKGFIVEDDAFDYRDQLVAKQCDAYYIWCQEEMKQQVYGLSAPYLFIRNDFTFNAFAASKPHFQIIALNWGMFEGLLGLMIDEVDAFEEPLFRKYKYRENEVFCFPPALMHQLSTVFVFAHELGHIMQYQGKEASFDEKLYQFTGEKAIDSHLREFDADYFATAVLTMRIDHYFSSLSLEEQTVDVLHNLTVMAIASVCIYFFKSGDNHARLYFDEFSHPHPYIRSGYITRQLSHEIANQSYLKRLDPRLVMSEATQLTYRMLAASETDIQDFHSLISENRERIDAYIVMLYQRAQAVPELSMNSFIARVSKKRSETD